MVDPISSSSFTAIKNEHYMPAFKKGMEENLAEIDLIVIMLKHQLFQYNRRT